MSYLDYDSHLFDSIHWLLIISFPGTIIAFLFVLFSDLSLTWLPACWVHSLLGLHLAGSKWPLGQNNGNARKAYFGAVYTSICNKFSSC
jgi:hypothetical protein